LPGSRSKKYDLYQRECEAFVKLCHDAGLVAKIIIQVGYLTDEEIKAAVKMVAASGAEFVKTATGTGLPAVPTSTMPNWFWIRLKELDTNCKMKVSGVVSPKIIGAYNFIRMGAGLIGTRSAPEIVDALPMCKNIYFP